MTPTYFNFAGGSTGYFGSVTASAVAAWQAANGVTPAVGYFGPVSQAKYTMLMAAAPATPGTDDSDDHDHDDDSSVSLSGEASLTTFEVADGDDSDDVEEGSNDMEVAEFTVEFSDGDAMITRLDIDVDIAQDGNDDNDPWDNFGDVSLMVDGDVVATIDASDKDNYLNDSADTASLRFSGLDIVSMEDEETVIVVVASMQNNLDGISDDVTVNVRALSMRFVDGTDVTSTETDYGDMNISGTDTAASFDVQAAGAGDDLNLEDSDANPDATTFALDEDNNVEEAIFAFDLSADDSDSDIELTTITLTATVTVASNVDDLVNDFRLEIGGKSFDAESYTGTSLVATIVFDIDGDVVIDADTTETAVLYADFEDMESADEGSTIVVRVETADIIAEGIEDVTVDGSTLDSNIHSLRTTGVDVQYVSDTVVADENNDTITTDNAADFTLKFTVSAFNDAVYLPFGAIGSTTVLTDGVGYSIVNTNTNAVVTTGTATPGVTVGNSSTVTKTNSYKISSADVTFTLTVNYDPTVAGSYKVRVDTINFATTDVATATSAQDVSDLNIETDAITISQ
jgi:peptidoglycan hydrolase-like protein with peptidoglycan-binding domain